MSKAHKYQQVAKLVIHGAPRMTPAGRRLIATWLREKATFLQRDGRKLAETFTARYMA